MIPGHDHPVSSFQGWSGDSGDWVKGVCAAVDAQCYQCMDAAVWQGVQAWESKGVHLCAMAATMAVAYGRYTDRMDPTLRAMARLAARRALHPRAVPRPKRAGRQDAMRAALSILCSVQFSAGGVRVDFPEGHEHPHEVPSGLVGLEPGFAPDYNRINVAMSAYMEQCQTCLAWVWEGIDRETLCALVYVARAVPAELAMQAPPALLVPLLADKHLSDLGTCATMVAQALAQGTTPAALGTAALEWAMCMRMPDPHAEQP